MGGTNVSLLNTAWLTADFGSTTVTSAAVFDAASGAAALESHLNGLGPGSHVVTVTGTQHEFIPSGSSPASAVRLGSGVKVSLRGTGELSLSLAIDPATLPLPGSPFKGGICVVQSGAKLVLRGPVLKGRGLTDTSNSDSLVIVDGGELCMYGGSIRDNVANRNSGGVHIESGGIFTMSGGTISGNLALTGIGNGGGVFVCNGGTFNMSGTASITQNEAHINGGGVYVESGGTFSMSDGTISGNTSGTTNGGGGGVYVDGTFNISSLTSSISANTPDQVYLGTAGTITGTVTAGW
jgi:hypothetical protein